MKNITKLLCAGALAFSLTGCPVEEAPTNTKTPKEPIRVDYFSQLNIACDTGMAMTSGDFDGDGDLDLIVGARKSSMSNSSGRLYFFENDGKGNFHKRTYLVEQ